MVYEGFADHELGWPQPHFEVLGGYRTAIYESGQGSPVMLFHGCSIAVDARLTWFRLLPELAQTHRVIAYDQPGFGLSDIPSSRELPDRMARTRHARDLIRSLDLDGLAAVGHSEGGFIATRLALDEPSAISNLVVVTSGATSPALGDDRDSAWQAAATTAYDYVKRSESADRLVETEERLSRLHDPAFEAILRANYDRDLGTGHVDMFRAVGRAREDYRDYAAVQEREVFPFVHRIRVPTLLIWGARDATVPVARGEALAQMIPDARFEVAPDAGHWVMHDSTAFFNDQVKTQFAG
jgi:pimeloyl-ACP methyl ester carboxylesterase